MKIIYTKAATIDVRKIKDNTLILKIEAVIKELRKADSLSNLKAIRKMTGHETAYRIRIRDYRLGIFYEDDTITIVRFLKRNDIYKLFP